MLSTPIMREIMIAVQIFRVVSSNEIGRSLLVGIMGVSTLGINTTHLSLHYWRNVSVFPHTRGSLIHKQIR